MHLSAGDSPRKYMILISVGVLLQNAHENYSTRKPLAIFQIHSRAVDHYHVVNQKLTITTWNLYRF